MGKQLFLALGFMLIICSSSYSEDVFIRDILDNPQKYYNLQIELQGVVVKVEAPATLDVRGYYLIMDSSDKTIKVVAETLPAPQEQVGVSGVVQVETGTQTPYIREISRKAAGGVTSNILIYVLIGLIVIVAMVLLFLIFKPKTAGIPQRKTGEEAFSPKAGSGTRQVSIEEVNAQVGGIKTTQVPSVLAELRILTGNMSGKSFPLKFETLIGRLSGDVVLEDSSVSKEHAKISFLSDHYVIENKSTTNPVILNGEKVQGQKDLKDGDEIICGFIKLQFKII